jgi:hypothetical protein
MSILPSTRESSFLTNDPNRRHIDTCAFGHDCGDRLQKPVTLVKLFRALYIVDKYFLVAVLLSEG